MTHSSNYQSFELHAVNWTKLRGFAQQIALVCGSEAFIQQ